MPLLMLTQKQFPLARVDVCVARCQITSDRYMGGGFQGRTTEN